jgi:septal ring factor EnvC (AmiA/AmiB activator)
MQRYGYTSTGRFITQEPNEINPFILLVTSEDIPQFIRRWHYLKSIAEYEYHLMNEYEKNLSTLQTQKKRQAELLNSLKKEQSELLKKEAELRHNKKKKRQLLASIRKERSLYKKMLAELKESSKRLRKLIIESEKKKFALKGFSKMKRRLPWPVKGRLALPYGSYVDPKFKTPVFRNGIHIKAREGETVRAVYAGKVVFADWFKGYGRVVIINHGEGYYTVYANLSEIFLSKGDIIKKGAPVGRVGESGTLNAPGLYFEVRYKGKPLNPLHWLRRRG